MLWYKPIQGEQPATVATVAPTPQPHQAQLGSTPKPMLNRGFHQSNLDLEILEWLRAELHGPSTPLGGAGSLGDAWTREKLYRAVKAKADQLFKYNKSYMIDTGPYIGTVFKVNALQDICFLRHTNCAKSTTGFANAEKDQEMARWLNDKARPGDTDFSTWSISKFWEEAQKRVETAHKKGLALQEKKQTKGKNKLVKKSKRVVESSEQKESEEEVDSDKLDVPQGSSRRYGRQ